MKIVKSLLLGSAAGLVALSGAQAADLPVKAKPVQYVKICSLYGAGFYYIPGTDTCLKVGGYVRAETNIQMGGSGSVPGTLWLDNRNTFVQDWRTRAAITLDARSQTEYGTLRSYTFISSTSDNSGTSNSAAPAPNNSSGSSGYVRLYAPVAFIQFAGFTFGKTDTFFNFDGMPYTNTTVYWGTNEGGNGVHVWAYTAQFGNGFSASLSLEDPAASRNGIANNVWGGAQTVGYADQAWPDLVANLRVDQPWGSAQVMGAIHDIRASDIAGVGGTHPGDETGFAIGAGAKLNLPTGKGDFITGQLTYTEGALRYITGNNGTGTAQYILNGLATAAVVPTSGAIGNVWDAVVVPGNTLSLTKGWSLTMGAQHQWNANWKTSLWGDYGKLEYSSASSLVLCGAAAACATASANWSLWQIGSRTVWTPVANLDLSLEVVYNSMQSGWKTGTAAFTPLGAVIPSDQDWWSGMIRVQRNFYP